MHREKSVFINLLTYFYSIFLIHHSLVIYVFIAKYVMIFFLFTGAGSKVGFALEVSRVLLNTSVIVTKYIN